MNTQEIKKTIKNVEPIFLDPIVSPVCVENNCTKDELEQIIMELIELASRPEIKEFMRNMGYKVN